MQATARVRRGVIDLWRIVHTPEPHVLGRLVASLSAEEGRHLNRIRLPREREAFVYSRGALRTILASYTATPPEAIRFRRNRHGKPRLDPARHTVDLQFSLSRSTGLTIVAVAQGDPVGIDIECIRPLADPLGVARCFFTAQESGMLERQPAHRRDVCFLRYWTGKEALLKALGSGLSGPTSAFSIVLGPNRQLKLIPKDQRNRKLRRWRLIGLQPTRATVGALACRTSTPLLHWFDFDPRQQNSQRNWLRCRTTDARSSCPPLNDIQ